MRGENNGLYKLTDTLGNTIQETLDPRVAARVKGYKVELVKMLSRKEEKSIVKMMSAVWKAWVSLLEEGDE